jgi:hypothetical protein
MMQKKSKEPVEKIPVTQHRYNAERGRLEEYTIYLEPWQIENLRKKAEKRVDKSDETEQEIIESEKDE